MALYYDDDAKTFAVSPDRCPNCDDGEQDLFIGEWGHTDPDLNLVFRWDWKRDEGEAPEPDKLCVYWVLQRKAGMRSTECVVTEDDEPAVLAWLTERAKTIAAIWAPIVPGGAS